MPPVSRRSNEEIKLPGITPYGIPALGLEHRKERLMKYWSTLFFLILAVGMNGQTTPSIRGIKIVSSGFDPQTHIAKLVFINDTPVNITAFRYHLEARTASPNDPSYSSSSTVDLLWPALQTEIDMRRRPWLPPATYHLIHPGESWEINGGALPAAVIDGSIAVDMVVYSDGTAEMTSSHSFEILQQQRIKAANRLRRVAEIGRQILENPADEHPLSAMRQALQEEQRRAPLDDVTSFSTEISEFESPQAGSHLHTIMKFLKRTLTTRPQEEEFLGEKTEIGALREYIADYQEMAMALMSQSSLKVVTK
ncbi:MAG TPA: hypothetical protein VKZ53_18430 [Candidatus Angelobacter sp.]|nr:hypothetical protein [Candidatus Angelobacter sp.]